MKQICQVLLFVCTFSFAAFSQDIGNTSSSQRQDELDKQKAAKDLDNRISSMRRLNDSRQPKEKTSITYRIPTFPKEMIEQSEDIKRILSPDSVDSARYQSFLQQPNTGLFRLFPDRDCTSKGVVRVDGNCEGIIPETWFYSFRWGTYSDDTYFDIRLKDGKLIGDGFLSQAVLVQLGDVPVENVSSATSGMKFLIDFKPETQVTAVRNQSLQIAAGIESDGYKYMKAVEASKNTTYAMRLIAYRSQNNVTMRFLSVEPTRNELKHLFVNYDKRIDMILAFRIVRQDKDGNLTILWKQLNSQNAPKIVFKKEEKLTDIR